MKDQSIVGLAEYAENEVSLGARPDERSLVQLQLLIDAGASAWWFDGDWAAARESWLERDVPVDDEFWRISDYVGGLRVASLISVTSLYADLPPFVGHLIRSAKDEIGSGFRLRSFINAMRVEQLSTCLGRLGRRSEAEATSSALNGSDL